MGKRSKRWVQEHDSDVYVRQARDSHYRSRAVYKLEEIDLKHGLFHPGQTVFDLGAAPGSWSQLAAERVGPKGKVIAVDILDMEPVKNVTVINGDFDDQSTLEKCLQCLAGGHANLVISDIAPNITGIRTTDQMRSIHLAELVLDFSTMVLNPGGNLLVKVFQGSGTDEFKRLLVDKFQKVIVRKPKASRQVSREFYMLALGYDV